MCRLIIAYRLFRMYRSVGQNFRASLRRAFEVAAL